MEALLEELLEVCRPYTRQGKVATYIPELAKGNLDDLGVYILRSDGQHFHAGDWNKPFAIQSVIKPILLLLALMDNVEEVLDFYFKACSISVTSKDLAGIGYVLSSHGRLPKTEERVFDRRYASYVNAILMTCGMYDGSGHFAVNVGVPAKSGVGGGTMAVVPTRMGIGIFSPGLDEKGNSLAGIQLLERLSKRMFLSIF